MQDALTGSSLSFLAGGGEMGERMRRLDWSETPLGEPAIWPQSLRSTLSMLLPSKAQIILFWGPDFTVFYNDAYRPVFGAKHPLALGIPGRDAWSEIWDTQLHALLAGVVNTGEAFWARDLLFQIERYGFLEETYFDVSYDPVRDESGLVGGVFCIVTETTERVVGGRRMTLLKDLAARNATARTAREACVLAMETLAAQSHDITCALAYLDEELQGATPGAAERLSASPPHLVRDLVVPLSIGRAGRLVVGLNPMRPLDDQYEAFLALVADQFAIAVANARAYEDQRRRAEALAELDRAKTTFFSNVSHEFRTPLTLMLGPIEKLLGEADGSLTAAQQNDLRILHRNAVRLMRLVNGLLDFSRIEAGRAQASYTQTDLTTLTADLASAFRSAIEHAGLRYGVDCGPIGAPVFVDRDMWEKVVLNLLSNALKFTFAGSIDVTLRDRGDAVELTVADTGIGIAEAELPRVFERFHRVEGAKARTHEGTGIGLALTHEFVRLHGGSITVKSRIGAGTSFVVRIPTGSAHLPQDRLGAPDASRMNVAPFIDEAARWLRDPALDGSPPPTSADGAAIRERVLIVDDNADMRDYLRQLLSEWEVIAAADGRAALDLAQPVPPSLIVTDVMMPGFDGFALLEALRRDDRTRGVPVLMLSARAGDEARISGLDAGADEYLVKPFSARELVARVRSLLNLSQARRDAESASRTKDEFLAMLGHELRNPLAPILTALQLMTLRGDAGGEKERAVIDRQVRHLVRLVDDLLDVSRIARGKIELRRQVVDLADVIASAVEEASPILEERRHRLEVHAGRGLTVDGDPTRLTQVLVNLISNAAKYTEPGGRIGISARRAGADVDVRVQDSGVGISEEMLPHVFDMFTQERQTLDRSRGGLGLGLTIVRSLVQLHGGSVRALSGGVGQGSEFIVRLPARLERDAAGSPGGDQTIKVAGGARRRRVLVVDDNVDGARLMADALRVAGYESSVAFDGPAALAVAAEFQPDAVLLDLGLPVMDGYEVAARLGEAMSGPPPVRIAVTGYGLSSDRERSREAGFAEHVVKPVDIPSLMTLLARLLDAKSVSP